MDLLLYARLDQYFGSLTIRAGKAWRGSEQAADQRALGVNLAALRTQVGATEIGQRRLMFRSAFERQLSHFFA